MIINPSFGGSGSFDGGVVSNDIILPGNSTSPLSATTRRYVDDTKQPIDATLTSLSALGTAADKIAYTTAVDTWAETPLTSAARSVLDDATVADIVNTIGGAQSTGSGGLVRATSPSLVTPSIGVARGTSLTVTGDVIVGGDPTTSLSATSKSYVDTNKQPIDATLTSLSKLGTAADKIAYTTGVDVWAETPLTSAARSVLDDATVSDIVNTIGGAQSTGTGGLVRATSPSLVTPSIGAATGTSLTVTGDVIVGGDPTTSLSATSKSYVDTNKQPIDATLTSLSTLGTSADKIAYTTSVDTWAETPLTSAARSVLDDATVADIVNTIGGSPSTGSGGLVRATSPSLVTPSIGAATGTSLTVTGTVSAASMNVSGLTASYVVRTDASKNFVSIQYATTSIASSLLQRDGNAGANARRFYSDTLTLTDAVTIAVDMSYANFSLTLGGNRTLGAPTNLTAGQSGVITVRQDATGSRTLAYAWPYVFQGGVAPTLSTSKFAMDQLNYVVTSYSTGACTMTIATPCVVTKAAHGFVSGMRVQFTTTGALPTGISLSTTYWVLVLDANTFQLSTSLANLQAGTYVATSGTQSGTHTVTHSSITVTLNPAINA